MCICRDPKVTTGEANSGPQVFSLLKLLVPTTYTTFFHHQPTTNQSEWEKYQRQANTNAGEFGG